MSRPLAFLAALLALTTIAEADWIGNWKTNLQLHDRWYMKPVERFFAVNGPPRQSWDTVGGVVGLGSQYAWIHGPCKVIIRTSPEGKMESLNSYGSCGGVVR